MLTKTSSDSDSENETQETIISKKWKRTSRNILDIPVVPELKTPLAVQAVLSKIEQAQLLRVKEVGDEWEVYTLQLFSLKIPMT